MINRDDLIAFLASDLEGELPDMPGEEIRALATRLSDTVRYLEFIKWRRDTGQVWYAGRGWDYLVK